MLQMILTFLMFLNAFLFTQTNHPMSMGIILLFQTMITCLMTGLMSKSFWFSYILFLVFIGGMLILFMYMSSIASNEKLNFSMLSLKSYLILFMLMSIFMFYDKFYILNNFFNNDTENFNTTNYIINENHLIISKMYNQPNNYLMILLILYLLLTMIMVVKMTNLFMGPLRPKFN